MRLRPKDFWGPSKVTPAGPYDPFPALWSLPKR